jgi:hypothetical protein
VHPLGVLRFQYPWLTVVDEALHIKFFDYSKDSAVVSDVIANNGPSDQLTYLSKRPQN